MNTFLGADENLTEERLCEDTGSENSHIDVGKFCQWLTEQNHVFLSHADREDFKIVIEFDHDCKVRYSQPSICYPVVKVK